MEMDNKRPQKSIQPDLEMILPFTDPSGICEEEEGFRFVGGGYGLECWTRARWMEDAGAGCRAGDERRRDFSQAS
jgi:hypothetical protein